MGRRHAPGFTLLETVVAMVVTGLIILTVAGSLSAVTSGWDRGEMRFAAREADRILGSRLGRELAVLDRGPFGAGVALAGTRERLEFAAAGEYGPRRLVCAYEGGRVVLREHVLRRLDAESEIVLAEGVDGLEFSYYDASARSWQSDWPGETRPHPPALVRVELIRRAEDGSPRRSAPVVLPVNAGRVYSQHGLEGDAASYEPLESPPEAW